MMCTCAYGLILSITEEKSDAASADENQENRSYIEYGVFCLESNDPRKDMRQGSRLNTRSLDTVTFADPSDLSLMTRTGRSCLH